VREVAVGDGRRIAMRQSQRAVTRRLECAPGRLWRSKRRLRHRRAEPGRDDHARGRGEGRRCGSTKAWGAESVRSARDLIDWRSLQGGIAGVSVCNDRRDNAAAALLC